MKDLLRRVSTILLLAVAAGVAAGFLHWVELLAARHLAGQLVWFSRDFVWMSPIVYTMVFLVGAVPLALLSTVVKSTRVLVVAAFGLATGVAFGLLLPYSEIARIAALILALGVGFQFARAVSRAPDTWGRRIRWFALGGAAVVGVLALSMPRTRDWSANRAISALPAINTELPNVLIIILDTVRMSATGLASGVPNTMPELAKWATEGATFDWAFVAAPWTLPSHASMFTGKYADEVTGDWKVPLRQEDSTLAELFRARGYATGAFVANMHYTAWDSGLEQGFARYEDYRTSWEQLVRSSSYTQTALFNKLRAAERKRDVARALRRPDLSIDLKHTFDYKRGEEVTSRFLNWQAGLQRRPFFAFLNYFDAHQPYYAPPKFHTFPPGPAGMQEYLAAISYLDANLDFIFDELRSRGILDNTVVIVTSDHGELFEENGLSGHAHNLYRNVLHVPLVIRFPNRVPINTRITQAVSLRDLAATVLDLAALDRAQLPGTSFANAWSGTTGVALSPARAAVSQAPNVTVRYPTSKGPMRAALDDSLHFIRDGAGNEQLFRYRVDTAEAMNLAADSTLAARRAALRALAVGQEKR